MSQTKQITPEQLLNYDNDEQMLYGIFDGASLKELWLDLDIWNLQHLPLYRGDYQPIAAAIPYVIELDKNTDKNACLELLGNVGENAVLLIKSTLSLDALTEKLQKHYHLKTADKQHALRRYYDPRHFKQFIEDIPIENRIQLFEDIDAFYSEIPESKQLVKYYRHEKRLETEIIELIKPPEESEPDDTKNK